MLSKEDQKKIIKDAFEEIKKGIIKEVKQELSWKIKDAIESEVGSAIREFVKTDIKDSIIEQLRKNKDIMIKQAVIAGSDIAKMLSKAMVEKLAKNLSSSWGGEKIFEAMFK